jgi:hypothetical protein
MTPQCCTGEVPSRRLARRLSAAAASLLPAAVMVLLPKCPLCLAAWLTVISGTAVSVAAAARLRGLIVVVCFAAVTFAAAQIRRNRSPSNRVSNSRLSSHIGRSHRTT